MKKQEKVFVPYRGFVNLNTYKKSENDKKLEVFVPYRGFVNLNKIQYNIDLGDCKRFSSPIGASLI